MNGIRIADETLDLQIDLDASTRLPLLSEQSTILDLIETYLPLPYIVAEHGCGKKCSLIIHLMTGLGIPPWALRRGMAMERDMSPEALALEAFEERKHALRVSNPLWRIMDLEDGPLRRMLEEQGIQVNTWERTIQASDFVLHDAPVLQFRHARSHIYPIITFWDAENEQPVDLVADPTLNPDHLFEPVRIRIMLDAPEAVLFSAPLLGRFRLDKALLTPDQRQELDTLAEGADISRMSYRRQAGIIRRFLGAEEGSIGDPLTWTYANNIVWGDKHHDEEQAQLTGQGDPLASRLRDLLGSRAAFSENVKEHLHGLESFVDDLELRRVIRADAIWSEDRLEPLVQLANTVVYRRALSRIAESWNGRDALDVRIDDPAFLDGLRGIEVRLRDRIEKASATSRDPDGRIDARALNGRFNRTVVEAVRQMNRAGLSVFIDRIGNVHGLGIPIEAAVRLASRPEALQDLVRNAICHCSHLDTVLDGGKWDGRLGVLSGIEIAHIIRDLEHHFDLNLHPSEGPFLMVTAFIGEEMTFTGEDVSMPGSAAITGHAQAEQIFRMQNLSGSRYRSKLVDMLRTLAVQQDRGTIELVNEFDSDSEEGLLSACFEPTLFYTPHTYERHIEQGGVLDRLGVPLVLVDRVMGIHQEDITFTGKAAEAAALEAILRLRELVEDDIRVTVGILEVGGEIDRHLNPAFAHSWTLTGEKNHAGATSILDRRDPGVAAARLVRQFNLELEQLNERRGTRLEGIVGSAGLSPGMNRNVIPEQASLVLSAVGAVLEPADSEALMRAMQSFLLGTLTRPVSEGGEGLGTWISVPVSFVNTYPECRISLDLRSPDSALMESFLKHARKMIRNLEEAYGVEAALQQHQHMEPISLQRSGQVLQIERSYGGSHNPNEAELAVDLLRGTVIQLESTMAFVSESLPSQYNLFDQVHGRIPQTWRSTLNTFVSGALHDTCNVALRRSRQETEAA